jgi:TonB-dependent SusC/RagA subfamily outer membrane receptor
MKNQLLIFISLACIITDCIAVKSIAQPKAISYNTSLIVFPSANVNKLMMTMSSISSFDQVFSNFDSGERNIKRSHIISARVKSNDPLGMFKAMKIYLSRGDGSSEVLVASVSNIYPYTEDSLILNLNKNILEDRTIKSDKINPNSSINQSISGQMGGVQAGPSGIRIRGVNTTGGATPLYIVNGIERDIQGINPSDIESIEILKNPVELAVYGMRGANGVVLVKTKNGNSDSEKKSASLDYFVEGSTMYIRLEYVLRYPLRKKTVLNINIDFAAGASNRMR